MSQQAYSRDKKYNLAEVEFELHLHIFIVYKYDLYLSSI